MAGRGGKPAAGVPGPGGIGEDVEVGYREIGHQGPGGLEIGGGFAGKAHQDVEAQAGAGKAPGDLPDQAAEILRAVRAAHGGQHRGGAALEG